MRGCAVVVLVLLSVLGLAHSNPDRLLAESTCGRDLAVGATIMGAASVASTDRAVTVNRVGAFGGLSSGATYSAGATVQVLLQGMNAAGFAAAEGLLEVTGGATFVTTENTLRGCSDTRTTTLTGAQLVLPASGTVTIRGLWASARGAVNVATEFVLNGPADPCAAVTCPEATSGCKVAGTCSTGQCSDETNAADGTVCDDADSATTNDVCSNGECAGTAPPPPARTCADTDADGTADNFDCAGEANSLDAAPASVTCAADSCTATECCTVAPTVAPAAAEPVASSGRRVAQLSTMGVLLAQCLWTGA